MEVNDEGTWPADVIAYLEQHYDLFLAWETDSGRAVTPQAYDRAILGLREVLNPHELHGYHCSRLTDGEIAHIIAHGMQLPNGVMLRDRIMTAHRSGSFDATVADRLMKRNNADDETRANKIWFCFFPPHIGGEGGISSLLGLWGGEALYRQHDRDPEIAPILSKVGTPCLVEADVLIASLRQHSFLNMKIVRQFLIGRGLQTREPVEHEDYARSSIPAAKIRRVLRHPEPDFIALTHSDTWRRELT